MTEPLTKERTMSFLKYEPVIGHISECIDTAIALANRARLDCEMTFNGTTVIVSPSHRDQVYQLWAAQRQSMVTSDRYAEGKS